VPVPLGSVIGGHAGWASRRPFLPARAPRDAPLALMTSITPAAEMLFTGLATWRGLVSAATRGRTARRTRDR
jgi:hypothetical protein